MWRVLTWRRERDSNPRGDSRPPNDLANRPLQPLGYLSSSHCDASFHLPKRPYVFLANSNFCRLLISKFHSVALRSLDWNFASCISFYPICRVGAREKSNPRKNDIFYSACREKPQVCLKVFGGESGIRTHGTLAGTTVFKTVTFNHSVISPCTERAINVQ